MRDVPMTCYLHLRSQLFSTNLRFKAVGQVMRTSNKCVCLLLGASDPGLVSRRATCVALLHKQEAVLKATAVQSPLPVMSLILPCPPCLPEAGGVWGQGGLGRGEGVKGGGGKGHFIHLASYCTTTWCFALKGLRTIKKRAAS